MIREQDLFIGMQIKPITVDNSDSNASTYRVMDRQNGSVRLRKANKDNPMDEVCFEATLVSVLTAFEIVPNTVTFRADKGGDVRIYSGDYQLGYSLGCPEIEVEYPLGVTLKDEVIFSGAEYYACGIAGSWSNYFKTAEELHDFIDVEELDSDVQWFCSLDTDTWSISQLEDADESMIGVMDADGIVIFDSEDSLDEYIYNYKPMYSQGEINGLIQDRELDGDIIFVRMED